MTKSKKIISFFKRQAKRNDKLSLKHGADELDFRELYQTYHRQIFNLCFRVTQNKLTAESLTAQVFVGFYQDSKAAQMTTNPAIRLRQLAAKDLLNYISLKNDLTARIKQSAMFEMPDFDDPRAFETVTA